ncbi:MAG: zinc ribbon domain-containing protein [Deltaproteobacteria bacterium]|nr:zinc ribbon domain-containing protein [Deltaproteobacteria bacterium]
MPLYSYKCRSCQKEHEVIQKFSDPPLKKCPVCGGKLEKLIQASTFQLKGGGWYKDGYSSVKSGSASQTTVKKEPEKKTDKKKD